MKKIIEILKNSNTQRILMIIIIFIFGFFLFKDCGRTIDDDKVTRLKQNIEYCKDSLVIVKNKANEIEYQRSVLASEKEKLEEQNLNLYKEVEKQKGTVISLTETKASLTSEIIELENKLDDSVEYYVYSDGTQSISWQYDTVYSKGNSKYIWGSTKFNFLDNEQLIDEESIRITLKDSLNFSLITGLEEDPDTEILNIFVRSNYPGFNVSRIDGAIIDPHESKLIQSYFPEEKFGIGFTLGYGINVDDGNIKVGPALIIGATYNFTTFNPRKIFNR